MARVKRSNEFMREQILQWVGRVDRMDEERGPVKALHYKLDGRLSKKGRPMKRWKEVAE